MKYLKYHALGNDYIVISPADAPDGLNPYQIRLICHRNFGVGSDGILYGPLDSSNCDFGLRILNPDGSEAEKSGNGLRIFARSLWDQGLTTEKPFTVETPGGVVTCTVAPAGRSVTVEMGEVSFNSARIPVAGPEREVIEEEMHIDERMFRYCAATVGNPHCIVFSDNPTPEKARRYGPLIETDARFPNRTNVQFMQVVDRHHIRIEIWERGAGYTLASGSSSTAAAATAYRLGRCDADIAVSMPGGTLQIGFTQSFLATMTGPVVKVSEGVMAKEMFDTDLSSIGVCY